MRGAEMGIIKETAWGYWWLMEGREEARGQMARDWWPDEDRGRRAERLKACRHERKDVDSKRDIHFKHFKTVNSCFFFFSITLKINVASWLTATVSYLIGWCKPHFCPTCRQFAADTTTSMKPWHKTVCCVDIQVNFRFIWALWLDVCGVFLATNVCT